MIRVRPGHTRGAFRNDWLDARFSFSFGDWRDPAFDGYSDLLVLNDDRVAPGRGFAEHGHADVEVMSYPLAGAVEHRDSLGQVALMRPGDVHLMRAGHGIRHSEMNASADAPEHHLQWWLRPRRRGLAPAYARLHVPLEDRLNRWRLLAAPDGGDGVLAIAQDARIYALVLQRAAIDYRVPDGRWTHLHVAVGALQLDGRQLVAGDGVFVENEPGFRLTNDADAPAEVLLFDLRAA